jgi:hypothetical protein
MSVEQSADLRQRILEAIEDIDAGRIDLIPHAVVKRKVAERRRLVPGSQSRATARSGPDHPADACGP